MDEPHILINKQERIKRPKRKFPGFSKVFENFNLTPQNRLILLLITLIIILVVVINYLREPEKYKFSQGQQTPTPTQTLENNLSNWKTYTNSKYLFSLKYPPNWQLQEYPENSIGAPSITIDSSCNPEVRAEICVSLHIDINLGGKEEYERLKIAWLADPNRYGSSRYQNIGGIEALAIERLGERRDGPLSNHYIDLLLIKDGVVFSIGYLESRSENTPPTWKNKDLFDQILSTFKFLEESYNTEEWLLYKNEGHGFELQYPPDWELYDRPEQGGLSLQILKAGPTNEMLDWTDGSTLIVSTTESTEVNLAKELVISDDVVSSLKTIAFAYSGWFGTRFNNFQDDPLNFNDVIIATKTSPTGVIFKINWSQINRNNNLDAEKYLFPILSTLKFPE